MSPYALLGLSVLFEASAPFRPRSSATSCGMTRFPLSWESA